MHVNNKSLNMIQKEMTDWKIGVTKNCKQTKIKRIYNRQTREDDGNNTNTNKTDNNNIKQEPDILEERV